MIDLEYELHSPHSPPWYELAYIRIQCLGPCWKVQRDPKVGEFPSSENMGVIEKFDLVLFKRLPVMPLLHFGWGPRDFLLHLNEKNRHNINLTSLKWKAVFPAFLRYSVEFDIQLRNYVSLLLNLKPNILLSLDSGNIWKFMERR